MTWQHVICLSICVYILFYLVSLTTKQQSQVCLENSSRPLGILGVYQLSIVYIGLLLQTGIATISDTFYSTHNVFISV